MTRRKRMADRAIGLVIALVAVWAVFALAAPAQDAIPKQMPPLKSTPIAPGEQLPPLELPPDDGDDEVLPAQFTTPLGPLPGAAQPLARPSPIADPPTPVVSIRVRVPADAPPGDDLKYTITVQNTSTAPAHGVTVRNPIPDGVEKAVSAEPAWEKDSTAKELIWKFGTIPPGKSKSVELTLRPKAGATEVKNLAYVRFEHGEAVTTRLNKPAVRITKTAPKQSVRDEQFIVRIYVDNTGRVPAEKVRVAENVPATAELQPITRGGVRMAQPTGQQWVWEIPKIMPGERKLIEYRVTAREAKDVFALTNLSADKGIQDKAEWTTKVLVPGLAVKLTGPAANSAVNPGESARYEITVRNAGTLPSTMVRVVGTLPGDTRPTMKTEGGQLQRDAIQWVVPRLEPGEARTFRFAVKAQSTGRRVVVATAADSRGQRAVDELTTLFQGTAALIWETIPNPVALAVGKRGTFTIKVRNNGGEAARNVRVEVDLPEAVSVVQVTPTISPTGNKLAFAAETVPAYGETVYTITYEAKSSAQAWFKLRLSADSLGDKPMQTEKAVEITGGGG